MNWRVSSPQMTVWVETDDAKIVTDGAPIIKKFVGQPLENLTLWLGRGRYAAVDIKLLEGKP